MAYWRYRKYWSERLLELWQGASPARHTRIPRLQITAPEIIVHQRTEYIQALLCTSAWAKAQIPECHSSPQGYKQVAEAVLAEIEKDISQRAITVGLVVGASRSPIIDLFTIAAAALEVQVHVLTRLGKRPSLSVWKQMLARTGSSLFLNSYLNQNQSLSLRIAIKRMGMGLEAASDALNHAATVIGEHLDTAIDQVVSDHHDDSDWDDVDHLIPHSVLGIPIKTLFDATRITTGAFLGVGTFGLRQLGSLIDSAGDELFQGALAGGVLYFHGMAIAADCLALDQSHRESTAMNRTPWQCVSAASEVAGTVLLVAIRRMRNALREKRRHAFGLMHAEAKRRAAAAVEDVGHAVKGVRERANDAVGNTWEHVKTAADRVGHRTVATRTDQTQVSRTEGENRDRPGSPSGTSEIRGVAASSRRLWQSAKAAAANLALRRRNQARTERE